MAPDQQPGAADLLQALVSGRTDSCERVTTYLRPDGTPVDLLVRCASVRDAQGTVALLVEHAVDNACPGAREALDLAAARAEKVVRLADLLQTAGRDARAVAAATSEALHAMLGGGVTVFIVDPADGVTIEGTALRTDDPLAEAELRRLYAQVPLRTDLGLLGEACRTGRPVIVEDPWATAPPSLMDYFPWLLAHPVRALLLVPLLWVHRATREVLREWVGRLRDQTGSGFPEKVTAFREEMAVHGRYGKPCPVCGAPVQRIVYAENETNYCARCQTGGRILADRALSRLLKKSWPRSIDELG
jgi:hypothetical protein